VAEILIFVRNWEIRKVKVKSGYDVTLQPSEPSVPRALLGMRDNCQSDEIVVMKE